MPFAANFIPPKYFCLQMLRSQYSNPWTNIPNFQNIMVAKITSNSPFELLMRVAHCVYWWIRCVHHNPCIKWKILKQPTKESTQNTKHRTHRKSFKSYFLVLQIKFSISRKSFFGVNFQDSIQYTIRDVRKDNDFARVTLVCAESGLDCITDDHQMKEHKTFYDHLHGRIGFNTVNPSQGRIVKSWIDDE